MNLAQIRDLFIARCGRYDLVEEDGSDNGADFFIQSGSRLLDRRANVPSAQDATIVEDVGPQGLLQLTNCWLVKDVKMYDFHSRPVQLQQIHSANSIVNRFQRGATRYYQLFPSRQVPNLNKLGVGVEGSMQPTDSIMRSPDFIIGTVIELLPHPGYFTTVEVRGRFYSDFLKNNEDENVWSIRYPDTLVKAALYELEVFYRNTEGSKDWLDAINLDLLDMEQIELFQEINGKDEMGM